MNKKHFYTAVILLVFLAIGIQPAIAINIPTDTSIGTWDPDNRIYTLTQNVSYDVYGTIDIGEDNLTLNGNENTVTGPGVGTVTKGILLSGRTGVIVKNVTVKNFYHGIALQGSSNNFLISNTTEYNQYGVYIGSDSDENEVSGNTVSNNGYNAMGGINLHWADDSIIKGNTIENNYNGIVISGTSLNNEVYNNEFISNTQRQVYLGGGSNNKIYNNNFNGEGTLEQVTVAGGSYSDIYYNNFNGGSGTNMPPYHYQVYVTGGHGNRIYNNNFFRGTGTFFRQAYVSVEDNSNVFNLPLPIGGNYWSDYWGEDRGDGIGDVSYTFFELPNQDNLPWVAQDGWDSYIPTPEQAIEELIVKVEALNGEYGISNALDAKLQNALDALVAKNAGQRQDAVNKMQAFINAVEAQSGDKIPVEIADELIADANYIISLL